MDTMQADTDAGMMAYIMNHPEQFMDELTTLLLTR